MAISARKSKQIWIKGSTEAVPKKLFDINQVAIASYLAYAQTLNFQTSLGVSVPTWQNLPIKEQEAWIKATRKTFELTTAYHDSST